MRRLPVDSIRNKDDLRLFARWCFESIGPGFHPDTDASDYVATDGTPLFDATEFEIVNRLLEEALAYGNDFYAISFSEMAEQGFAPRSPCE